MKDNKTLVIGTRGSKLALWQAHWVKAELERISPGIQVSLNVIKTTGDKITDVALAKVGGKGLFVKEIEEALVAGEADLAVHSMKDVPTELPAELHLKAVCRRESPGDALISRDAKKFHELPEGARVGTSSLRRACQILRARPGLKIENLRGNLDTRLRKLDEGRYDAIILAEAGLKRLGFASRITETLPPKVMLPAIGQGAIGIECRREDPETNALVALLDHEETSVCVRAERAFLKRLEGGCQVPIAAHARLSNGRLHVDGLVGSPSGKRVISGSIEGEVSAAEELGVRLAESLLVGGAKEILEEVYGRGITPVDGDVLT